MNKTIIRLSSQQRSLIAEQITLLEKMRRIKEHHLDTRPTAKTKNILHELEEKENAIAEQILSLNVAMTNEYDKEDTHDNPQAVFSGS